MINPELPILFLGCDVQFLYDMFDRDLLGLVQEIVDTLPRTLREVWVVHTPAARPTWRVYDIVRDGQQAHVVVREDDVVYDVLMG